MVPEVCSVISIVNAGGFKSEQHPETRVAVIVPPGCNRRQSTKNTAGKTC